MQGLPGLSKKSSGIDECMRREERRTHTMPVTAHTAKLVKMETDQVAKQASQGKQRVPNRSQNQLNLHLPQTNQSTQYRPTRPRSLIHLLTSQLLGALSRRGYQTGYLAQHLQEVQPFWSQIFLGPTVSNQSLEQSPQTQRLRRRRSCGRPFSGGTRTSGHRYLSTLLRQTEQKS